MNTESIDFRFLAESDGSPLLVFNHKGHVVYLNDAAEILLGYADHKELFEIALTNAPKDFGSRTVLMELHYHQLLFYAVTIAYNTDEWVSLRLYYRPRVAEEHRLDSSRMRLTDFNQLLDMAIGFFSVKNPGKIQLVTDRDLPPFKTDQNSASLLLRKALESFDNSRRIDIILTMALGEYIHIDGKRFPVLRLTLRGDERQIREDRTIEELAESIGAVPYLEKKKIVFDLPFIKEE